MSRRISDERLAELHGLIKLQVKPRVKNNSKKETPTKAMVYVDGQELCCLLDELRQRRNRPKEANISRYTQLLMDMEVGDSFEVEPMTQSRLSTLRRTARKRMGVADARWHAETQPNGLVLITRMPDGSDHIFGKPKNPAVIILASMMVGEIVILHCLKGKIYHSLKMQARKQMDYADAHWRFENLANGSVRAERIR